jgi:glycosyltransferase involved in cell wall biosynthesis
MNRPKVSVCIPTFNYARFLPEAIDSVLSQTFLDCEMLIIDDCSDDNTQDVIKSYADRDKRIRFRINPSNIGMVNNWNLCLNDARGEYIKFVFGDDLLSSPDTLQKMVSLMDSDPGISLVSSATNLIDMNSRILKVLSYFKGDIIRPGEIIINRCLSEQKNHVGGPSVVMFRKEYAARGFLPRYRHIVDLEMWLHLLEKGRFAYLKEPLCSFRIHSDQETAKNRKRLSAAEDNFMLYEEYMNKPYIKVSSFRKQYIQYDNVYQIWKLYTANCLTKEEAVKVINSRYGYPRFRAYYLFYKLFKPFFKLYRKTGRKVNHV